MAYRVLIVDDSPAMRVFIRRVIEISGFELSECYEAGNGEEAMTVLKANWVDAILTDINMPVVDGEEFLRRLSNEDMLRSVPAIVISTDATKNRIDRMMALGARGYVTKPFRPEDLRAELERTLEAPLDSDGVA
jgi:two-component system, chemotaxis family, chemotaxis protein CheY